MTHHQKVVNEEFKSSLTKYVNENILPHLTIKDNIEGTLKTDFDEERYLGPNSICKYRYNLLLETKDNNSSETVRMTFQYNLSDKTITPIHGGPHIDSIEAQNNRDKQSRQLIEIQRLVKEGKTDIPCPECGEKLDLSILQTKDGPVASWIICKVNQCIRAHINVGRRLLA